MNRQSGVAFISDTRLPSTFAREAGHFVGDLSHEGTDNTLLMPGDSRFIADAGQLGLERKGHRHAPDRKHGDCRRLGG